MIPFHDENPTKHFPLLTIVLIGANIFVFFWEFSYPGQVATLFTNYGLVPQHFVQSPIQTYPNVFSAMFLHAGLMHLAGAGMLPGKSEASETPNSDPDQSDSDK